MRLNVDHNLAKMYIQNCELVYHKSLLSGMDFCYKRTLYYNCHSKHSNEIWWKLLLPEMKR